MESELRPGAAVLSDLEHETDEELWTGDDDGDHGGWFCVRTDPFPCPAEGCSFVAEFMTAAHLVLVWQERDDPNLLWHAQRAKEVGRNPRVVGYESLSVRAPRTTPGRPPDARCTASSADTTERTLRVSATPLLSYSG